ncbi:MAG: AbrB/MazE/SpoVT family DNA-binding domain-containing protein [bacterium]
MVVRKIGKRGTFVIPSDLRERFGLEEGQTVLIEETDEGILVKPAETVPVETYSPERKAEFLLNNAVTKSDYEEARQKVKNLGLKPDDIPHDAPDS